MIATVIGRCFPQLHHYKWAEVNLDDIAKDIRRLTDPMIPQPYNPFLDPVLMEDWLEFIHKTKGVDASWGGYMEDRSVLWAGHYHKPGETVHLGIDINVKSGTPVAMPVDGKLVHHSHDPDQHGGWGGKLIFQHGDLYFVLGHLDIEIPADIGREFRFGERLGKVAEHTRNGGWYAHLHVQCMRELDEGVDGYARNYPGVRDDFPNPIYQT